jgi:hypothetical protein
MISAAWKQGKRLSRESVAAAKLDALALEAVRMHTDSEPQWWSRLATELLQMDGAAPLLPAGAAITRAKLKYVSARVLSSCANELYQQMQKRDERTFDVVWRELELMAAHGMLFKI